MEKEEKVLVEGMTKKEEPEPIVKELLAYNEELKKNPSATPPQVLVDAYKRGTAKADDVFDKLKEMGDVFTGDGEDNARVFFFTAMRLSELAMYMTRLFIGSKDNFMGMYKALIALQDYVGKDPK